MKQALIYTLKVWLTIIVLTPALRLLMAWVFGLPIAQMSLSYVEYYELSGLYGLIFSLPGAIMLWIFITIINRKPMSATGKKAYISALAFIEMMLTFYYIFWIAGSWKINIIMTIPYIIIAALSIWGYKLQSAIVSGQENLSNG